tara:strand:- start:906 stop:1586 length:681 start_codon:yes stop_codon:yes gene_type:complete
MPTGKYELDGKLLPGTTTIIGKFKNSGALIHWAWKQGLEQIDYRTTRDTAGSQGTSVHNLAESFIKGRDYEEPTDEKVIKAFNKFKEWWIKFVEFPNSDKFEIGWTEQQMVSKKYLYGGCPDLLVKKNGKYILIDFKTGKAIYEDTVIQLGAYAQLIQETDNINIDKAIIVRLPKDNSKLEIKEFSKKDLKLGFAQFKLFRKGWDNHAKIERLFTKNKRSKKYVNR